MENSLSTKSAIQAAVRLFPLDFRTHLLKSLLPVSDYQRANAHLEHIAGIQNFFRDDAEYAAFLTALETTVEETHSAVRREYGDFQTPPALTQKICAFLTTACLSPTVLIEPTFGRGAFIRSALASFPTLRQIYGIEIHEPYLWETKLNILEYFFEYLDRPKSSIRLFLSDVFAFDFQRIPLVPEDRVLVLGNPPWVTNTELSRLNSNNLPQKSNKKALSGIEAMTGQSNFDISESIVTLLFEHFSMYENYFALLLKNSVITALLHHTPKAGYFPREFRTLGIDTKKYFDASVEASLCCASFGPPPESWSRRITRKTPRAAGQIGQLDSPEIIQREFGWCDGKFVADSGLYAQVQQYDGESPYTWRQGVKHDCANIMELQIAKFPKRFINGLHEQIEIEDELVYPLLKSSDLQQRIAPPARKRVIITQKSIGEDTAHLAQYPNLSAYLQAHREYFERRKSSIYREKPPFSIFGIGEYSFKPYKVAISGLYKHSHFTLIQPENEKPVMLDDTCYFLGFDDLPETVMVWGLLNSQTVQRLIQALVFPESKRPYTKKLLMRIALDKVAQELKYDDLLDEIRRLDDSFTHTVTQEHWNRFVTARPAKHPKHAKQ